jgi:hypothetical protein
MWKLFWKVMQSSFMFSIILSIWFKTYPYKQIITDLHFFLLPWHYHLLSWYLQKPIPDGVSFILNLKYLFCTFIMAYSRPKLTWHQKLHLITWDIWISTLLFSSLKIIIQNSFMITSQKTLNYFKSCFLL